MAVAAWLHTLSILFLVAMVGCNSINDTCIQCLCEAINEGPSCSYLVGCDLIACGPYAITLPYWADAGRHSVGLGDRNQVTTYQKCTTDIKCSETTIRSYMSRFKQDCNQDGTIDCYDYAAIHFHGPYSCSTPLAEPSYNALKVCLERSVEEEENTIPDSE